jgi:hypothetical protein
MKPHPHVLAAAILGGSLLLSTWSCIWFFRMTKVNSTYYDRVRDVVLETTPGGTQQLK